MTCPRHGSPPNGLTLVSLFAGCGGSSLGYRMAGYDVRLAVDRDPKAAETYRANFPVTPFWEGDVAELNGDEALRLAGVAEGELDVLDGSPPCQGFSMAGKRRFFDRKNLLFKEFARLLRAFKPRAFVMENVPGMAQGKMRLIFADVTRDLKAAGYLVSCRLLNAWWWGVPQDRRRLVWVGVRASLGVAPSHPQPTVRKAVTVAEALSLAGITSRWRGAIKNARYLNEWRPVTRPSPTLNASQPPLVTESHQPQVLEAWEAAAPFVGSFQSVRLDPSRPSPSQIAAYRNWRWDEPRYLTVEEAKILHGYLPGSEWETITWWGTAYRPRWPRPWAGTSRGCSPGRPVASWPASSPTASKMGRAVKSKDTAWEVAVRSAVWRAGFRFRKNWRALPGTPDLAFLKLRLAVFLDSCFWHACPLHGIAPKANAALWEGKFRRNRERDRRVDAELARMGWRILRVWGHEADPVGAIVSALGDAEG